MLTAMPGNEVGANREFESLKLRYAALKERVSNQIELYTHLIEVVGPNLRSRYLVLVGQLEHRIFELKTDVIRWRRRFALRQTALNRGETPDLTAIEAELDAEFSEYVKAIKRTLQDIRDAASHYNSPKLSDKEAAELRSAYLDAVKRLHPDINANIGDSAKELWNQIQKAYSNGDWKSVKLLASLVGSVLSGTEHFSASNGGVAELKAACAKLETKSRELTKMSSDTKARAPFTYMSLLEDDGRLAETQAHLKEQIEMLKDQIRAYERAWKDGK